MIPGSETEEISADVYEDITVIIDDAEGNFDLTVKSIIDEDNSSIAENSGTWDGDEMEFDIWVKDKADDVRTINRKFI